jgi:hypothetical protein
MNIRKMFQHSKPQIIEHLEDVYSHNYQSFGCSRKQIQEIIKQELKKSKAEGTDKLPPNFGDFIIEHYHEGNENCKRIVDKAINGGANLNDVRHWWNLHEIERRMITWEDNCFRLATFKGLMDEGMTNEEAVKKLRFSYPLYGDPTDESNMSGEDRPLPDELHDRVNKIAAELSQTYLNEDIKKFSSMNSFLRASLKKKI